MPELDKNPLNTEKFKYLISQSTVSTERWTISIGDFKELSGLSVTTIYKAISENRITVIKIGRRTLISIKEAKKFLNLVD